MRWKDILRESPSSFNWYRRNFGSGEDYLEAKIKFAKNYGRLVQLILREIEKEGGALGMKNLKQFAVDGVDLEKVLSRMEEEGKIFMHEDGDIYTHEPKK